MKSLANEQDVLQSRETAEGAKFQRYLKVPDYKTPWYIMDLGYSDSWVHWVDLDNGQTVRLACAGGPDTDGFVPELCPICAFCLSLYKEGKKVRDTDPNKADKLKKRANRMRASYEAIFVAARGTGVVERTKYMKGGKAYVKKQFVADFDPNSDLEDVSVEVGLLRLTRSSYQHLTDLYLKKDEHVFIRSGADLGNRVLWSTKKAQQNRKFPEVVWTPEREVSDPPDLEYDKDKLDPKAQFEIEDEELKKVYNYLTGEETLEELGEEEEVEDEIEEEAVEEEPGDDYLDDVEGEDEEGDAEEEVVEEEEEIVEEEEPEPEPEPEPPKRKAKAKKASPKGTSKTRTVARSVGKDRTKTGKKRI